MKKKYYVISLTSDGKCYNHSIVLATSFFDACKLAKSFSRATNLTIMGIIEDKTVADNFILPNS
nr:MAG TPA: hypothetical protein [Microviridae sp.]